MRGRKAISTKRILDCVYNDQKLWNVHYGALKRGRGRREKTEHLFRVAAEKIPYAALSKVRDHLRDNGFTKQGVYIAHDSMGIPRYIGHGDVFNRLEARKRAQELELVYFSFYIVKEKKHEREIETLLIRAAGPLLEFNERKKRVGILPGSIRDYEADTCFYERQYRRGKKVTKRRKRN